MLFERKKKAFFLLINEFELRAGYKNKLQILCTLGGETIRTKTFTTQKREFLTV